MRVLHVSKYYPPDAGGIERVVRDLTVTMNGGEFEIDVLALSPTRTRVDRDGSSAIYRARAHFVIASMPVSPAYIYYFLRITRRYDIIHVHYPNPFAGILILLLMKSCKLVIHWHSDIVRQKHLYKLYRPIEALTLRRADAIVVTSPNYAQGSTALAEVHDKLTVVPIGIDPEIAAFTPIDSSAVGNDDAFKVLAVGRLVYYKGIDVLISAASRLPEQFEFLIVGTGPEEDRLRGLARVLGVEDRVRFLGSVSDDQLNRLYSSADVFVLPSVLRAEAFGVVQLEAMKFGLPVISCCIPNSGVSWVNRDKVTGEVVRPGDPEALAEVLLRLKKDPGLRKRYGENGLRTFRQDYHRDLMAGRVSELYKRLTA